MKEPKVLEEKTIYQKEWITIKATKLQFPNGNIAEFYYPDLGEAVAITPVNENLEVYLVSEWRASWKRPVLQIPAGGCKAQDEAGRIQQARYELMEEIGFDCKNIEKLCSTNNAGRTKLRVHNYLATDLFESKRQPDENEYLEVIKMPLDDAIKLFLTKEETLSFSLLGLLLAKEKLK